MMSESDDSPPYAPPDSPGSSVSTRLQEEYDELLKYAVVLPNYDPAKGGQMLTDARSSFPQGVKMTETLNGTTDPKTFTGDIRSSSQTSKFPMTFPNFNPSPIGSQEEKRDDDEFELEQPDKSTPRLSSHYSAPRPEFYPEREIEKEVEEVVYTTTIDPDVAKMENVLDQWTLDLKRNILAEFGQAKIRIVEKSRYELQKERERFVSDKNQMMTEMDKLKELLHTYEQSIERKDQVISNLTHAMNKQREKYDMLKKFTEWKLKHNDLKREAFASNLAEKHYRRCLSLRVWAAWRSVIESKWKQRVEKACQAKAQEVCVQLTHDYEGKVSKLNEALEAANAKIGRLSLERERYEEDMKKAFMRGVCALNMEAMNMFHGEENEHECRPSVTDRPAEDDISDNLNGFEMEKDYAQTKIVLQDTVYSSKPSEPPPPRIVTSQGSRSSFTQSKPVMSSRPSSAPARPKVVTAKVTAKVDAGKSGRILGVTGQSLAPPMASVIVERHQPVTKQTIGKATASKYPAPQVGQVYKKLAGQGSPIVLSPNIQSVKVVE